MGETGASAQHDLIIIGGGPGGYAAALYAAGAGLDVALVEAGKLGGTCLHAGCIPTKELLEVASVFQTVAEAGSFGVNTESPVIDMLAAQQRKQNIIDQLHKGVETLLAHRKVAVYTGYGTLLAEETGDLKQVTVAGTDMTEITLIAPAVILATGSAPRHLALPGVVVPGLPYDGQQIVSSDHLLNIEEVPSTSIIVGAGAIGCEFASMLNDLGSDVTLLESNPSILPASDPEVSKTIATSFKKRGIDIINRVVATSVDNPNGSVRVTLDNTESHVADCLIVAVGRQPMSASFGGATAGIKLAESGHVVADEYCQTSRPGIYAIGDLIGTPQLAHVAFSEALLAVRHITDSGPEPINYASIPWGIYTRPEIAHVGLTEPAAREAGYDIKISMKRFAGNSRAMIVGETDGFIKTIAERKLDGGAGRILGVHIVGHMATELLGQAYLTVNWKPRPMTWLASSNPILLLANSMAKPSKT